MTAFALLSGDRIDAYEQLVRELQTEFRHDDVTLLADWIVQSEAVDFYWEARVRERYVGHHTMTDVDLCGGDEEFVRVVVLSFLRSKWHVGCCVIDGEGRAVDLLSLRSFDRQEQAETAFAGRY